MKVIQIKKVKNLYEVIFNEAVINYHEEVIIKYNLLRSNIELTNNEYELSLLDNRFYLCRDKAINYLKQLKFKSQVKKHLLKTEELHIVTRVLEDLVERKIIDDYLTSTIYVQSKYNKGYGSIELTKKLNNFYVKEDIIKKVLLEQRDAEVEGINKYINKLFKTIKALNNKDLKIKIENRLITHGYLFSDIRDVINQNNDIIYETNFDIEIFKKYFNKAINRYSDIDDKYISERKIKEYLISKGFEISLVKQEINDWKNEKGD